MYILMWNEYHLNGMRGFCAKYARNDDGIFCLLGAYQIFFGCIFQWVLQFVRTVNKMKHFLIIMPRLANNSRWFWPYSEIIIVVFFCSVTHADCEYNTNDRKTWIEKKYTIFNVKMIPFLLLRSLLRYKLTMCMNFISIVT